MSLWQIFRWPLVLAVLTTAGLIVGLTSDGAGDLMAWLGLGVPVVAAQRFAMRRREP